MKLAKRLSAKKITATALALFVLMAVTAYGRGTLTVQAPPVFWNVFEAGIVKNKVILKWVVTEYNNRIFYIQHSQNGSDWKTIDSVITKDSPLTLDEYTYTHINKLDGRQYYRVRQVDIDGTRDGYSPVITTVLRNSDRESNTPKVTLWPNPASDQVRIIDESTEKTTYKKVVFYDMAGKTVAEKQAESHTNIINIRDLPTGIYVVRVEATDGTYFTRKVIKQ